MDSDERCIDPARAMRVSFSVDRIMKAMIVPTRSPVTKHKLSMIVRTVPSVIKDDGESSDTEDEDTLDDGGRIIDQWVFTIYTDWNELVYDDARELFQRFGNGNPFVDAAVLRAYMQKLWRWAMSCTCTTIELAVRELTAERANAIIAMHATSGVVSLEQFCGVDTKGRSASIWRTFRTIVELCGWKPIFGVLFAHGIVNTAEESSALLPFLTTTKPHKLTFEHVASPVPAFTAYIGDGVQYAATIDNVRVDDAPPRTLRFQLDGLDAEMRDTKLFRLNTNWFVVRPFVQAPIKQ